MGRRNERAVFREYTRLWNGLAAIVVVCGIIIAIMVLLFWKGWGSKWLVGLIGAVLLLLAFGALSFFCGWNELRLERESRTIMWKVVYLFGFWVMNVRLVPFDDVTEVFAPAYSHQVVVRHKKGKLLLGVGCRVWCTPWGFCDWKWRKKRVVATINAFLRDEDEEENGGTSSYVPPTSFMHSEERRRQEEQQQPLLSEKDLELAEFGGEGGEEENGGTKKKKKNKKGKKEKKRNEEEDKGPWGVTGGEFNVFL